jgi:PAS domain S-box-containing protein
MALAQETVFNRGHGAPPLGAKTLGQPEYARIIDRLPVAAYAIDLDGRLVYFNRAAAKLAGREPQLGSDKWCVTWKLYQADGAPLPHDKCPMAIALKERREIRGVEAIAERPDGARIWIEPFPTLLFDREGELAGAVNVLIDITERKRAADALRAADQRKNRFLAQISHELRNPC